MPKISAPTVVEHRAAQRAALLGAGEAVLLESGLAGVSPRTVSERAGLARSSFYDYFSTRDDLLVAIAIAAIERWDAEIEAALADSEPGLAELRTFVDATMAMTAEGRHEIAGALREADLSPSSRDDVMALHEVLMRPVLRVIAQFDVEDARATAALAQGVLGSGVQLVSHGMDHRAVANQVYGLLTRGLFA